MLDIFKGAAVTLVVWALVVRCLFGFDAGFFWALPLASFLLPVVLPNGRWLIGHLIFCTGAIALIVISADRSWGAALVLAILARVAVAIAVGVAARYALGAARAWCRERTHAQPVPEKVLPPISRRSIVLTACAIVGLLAIYPLYVMYSAQSSAQRIAAGRAYCVQVPTNGNYRSVTSRLDLLGFRMMGGGSMRHAVLVVRNGSDLEAYHWSYFSDAFVRDDYANRPIFCDLIPSFLAHPRGYRQETANSLSFQMQGLSLSIPKVYAPVVSTTGDIDIEIPGTGRVDINVRSEGLRYGRRATPGSGLLVEPLGEEHGLTKERVGDIGLKYRPDLQFYELDSSGKEKTLLICAEAANAICSHSFNDGKFSYYFNHPASDLANWQQIQQSLSAIATTFLDSPADQ